MGRGLLRTESTDHTTLLRDLGCLPIFDARGWENYMFKLSPWNEELALEFFQMLRDGFDTLRGVRVLFSPEITANIMELMLEGE